MPVDIFGSSDKKSNNSNAGRKYIDSKFITLTQNLNTKLDKNGGVLSGDLVVDGARILNLSEPTHEGEVANKKYVDLRFNTVVTNLAQISNDNDKTKYVKNNVGLVPNLTSNKINKSGFIVSAESELSDEFKAYFVFNFNNKDREWRPSLRTSSDFWIQLQCPQNIKIYNFTLRGRNNPDDSVIDWRL